MQGSGSAWGLKWHVYHFHGTCPSLVDRETCGCGGGGVQWSWTLSVVVARSSPHQLHAGSSASLCPKWFGEPKGLLGSPRWARGVQHWILWRDRTGVPKNQPSMTEEREHVLSAMISTKIFHSSIYFLPHTHLYSISRNYHFHHQLFTISLSILTTSIS